MIRKFILKFLWPLVILGGIALFWWFDYGPWQDHGNTLLSHDIVRFGPAPIAFTTVWLLLLFFTLLFTLLKTKEKNVNKIK